MKRPHRRAHLMMWLVLAPLTTIAGFFAWTMRPAEPFSDLPPGVETVSDAQGEE